MRRWVVVLAAIALAGAGTGVVLGTRGAARRGGVAAPEHRVYEGLRPDGRAHPFTVLQHLGYSFDDAMEACVTFTGDGSSGDPAGITGKRALRLAYGEIETKLFPDGRESLCRIDTVGSPGCTFREGTWVHVLVRADGTKVEVPNDVRSYRVHHGEIDGWLWNPSGDPPYDGVGITIGEACGRG